MKNVALIIMAALLASQGNAQNKWTNGFWTRPSVPAPAPTPVHPPVVTPPVVHPPVVTPPVVTPPVVTPPVVTPPVVTPPVVTPPPAPVIKCQPWQIEKHGECICDDDVCNAWKHSHTCTI